MDLNNFATNVELSEEGVWCPVDAVTEIRVARYGNRKFQRLLQKLSAPYKVQMERQMMKDDVAEAVFIEALATAILVDWRGMTENGEPLPYSKENAIAVLSNPKLKDFRDLVVSLSQDAEMFRDEEVSEAKEKSQSGTDGKSSGDSTKSS